MQRFFFLSALIALMLTGCGKPAPEEYLAKATAAREAKNLQQAIDEYERLLKDHPGSSQAEEALFQIASVRNDDMKDFSGAVEAYGKYLESYPAGKFAPVAMFLSGYLLHNELHDTIKAKAAYEKFIEAFPTHELVESARFEIKNLGKKPEEIIPSEPQVTATAPKQGAAKN